MTGLSLAIKYRPKTFEEIIGQEDTVNIVKGLIKEKKILGRGLFLYGPSGVGKTSLARVIAHHVNCENYDYENCLTCGSCDFCKAVALGKDPAVEEMNFSNTRGIDTVRSIIDSLEYIPFYKARVLILGEMHLMTKDGSNAILTTLEEPPNNTIFILCTTEPKKVLPTIRNRCVKLPFRSIVKQDLIGRLKEVSVKEGVQIDDYAFEYIAKSADGILREGLASLEALMCIKKINPKADLTDHHFLEEQLEVGGSSPISLANFLVGGIYMGTYGKTMSFLARCAASPTFNHRMFVEKLFEYHQQSFYFLIDPNKAQTNLFNDFYNDWYETLLLSVRKKALLLTVNSSEVLFELMLEMLDRLKNFDADPNKLLMVYTTKMVRAVKEHASTAYTKKSPFHFKFAQEHCLD